MKRIALLMMSICVVPWALADQVSLKNGDRLSGTIVKSDGKTLVLKTDYAGALEVKWDAVAGIVPKRFRNWSHPSTAPGTDHDSGPCVGISDRPRLLKYSMDAA